MFFLPSRTLLVAVTGGNKQLRNITNFMESTTLVLLGFHIRQEVPKNCYLCSGGFQIMVQGELGGVLLGSWSTWVGKLLLQICDFYLGDFLMKQLGSFPNHRWPDTRRSAVGPSLLAARALGTLSQPACAPGCGRGHPAVRMANPATGRHRAGMGGATGNGQRRFGVWDEPQSWRPNVANGEKSLSWAPALQTMFWWNLLLEKSWWSLCALYKYRPETLVFWLDPFILGFILGSHIGISPWVTRDDNRIYGPFPFDDDPWSTVLEWDRQHVQRCWLSMEAISGSSTTALQRLVASDCVPCPQSCGNFGTLEPTVSQFLSRIALFFSPCHGSHPVVPVVKQTAVGR